VVVVIVVLIVVVDLGVVGFKRDTGDTNTGCFSSSLFGGFLFPASFCT
jgi:hypothetical protein